MNSFCSRRGFLARSFSGAAALGAVVRHAPAADPAPDERIGLSTYQLGPQIWVRWNNRLVTCYRAHRSQKFPWLYPLSGPATGLSVTAESSAPYPHHRSAWFGCDRVNGGNYWQEGYEQGQVLSEGPRLGARGNNSVEILDACDWQKPGGPVVMRDRRRMVVSVPGPAVRHIDWDMEWTAVTDITVLKTNHSLFSVRGAEDLVPTGGGSLVNAEGATGEAGTYGKASAWCAFHGRRAALNGGETTAVTEGIALFDHPRNPWSPCPWFTRDYGFMSPTPLYFREQPWTLAAGQSVRLRYRLVIFAGAFDAAALATAHREWAA